MGKSRFSLAKPGFGVHSDSGHAHLLRLVKGNESSSTARDQGSGALHIGEGNWGPVPGWHHQIKSIHSGQDLMLNPGLGQQGDCPRYRGTELSGSSSWLSRARDSR